MRNIMGTVSSKVKTPVIAFMFHALEGRTVGPFEEGTHKAVIHFYGRAEDLVVEETVADILQTSECLGGRFPIVVGK
jgi:hypothetical protein